MIFAATSDDVAIAFIELGAIVLGLAVLARLSDRLGVSPIPAYLVAGLLFGDGGLAAPELSGDFLQLAAEIGVVLLLLTLGLEYTPDELARRAAAQRARGRRRRGAQRAPGRGRRVPARLGRGGGGAARRASPTSRRRA